MTSLQVELQFNRVHFTSRQLDRWNKYFQEVDMVQVQTIERQCIFDDKPCIKEGDCRGCQVFLNAMKKADKELGLCPVCGADTKVWEEVLHEKHYCDPKWRELCQGY